MDSEQVASKLEALQNSAAMTGMVSHQLFTSEKRVAPIRIQDAFQPGNLKNQERISQHVLSFPPPLITPPPSLMKRLLPPMLVTTPRPPGIPPGLPSGSGPSSEFSQFPLPNELPPQLPPAASLAPLPGVPSTINLRPLREQDRLLPVSNVFHLVSSQLPANVKVSKDAKIFMQEVISEFIGFVTSEANDVCLFNKQKAISGADIITALQNLGMPFILYSHSLVSPLSTLKS